MKRIALLALMALAANASELYITSLTQNVDDGGQFLANLGNAGDSFYIYCVDYRNFEASPTEVNISTPNTSLPDNGLGDTRYGQTPVSGFSFYNLDALDRYVEAAWLTTQYSFSSGVTLSDDQIQNAIWTLLCTDGTSGFPFGDISGTGNWVTLAGSWLSSQSSSSLAGFESEIQIFTSVNVALDHNLTNGIGSRYDMGTQEMIHVNTPEPNAAWMAVAGVALILCARMRQNQKKR